MAPTPEQWFESLGALTKTLFLGTVGATVLVTTGLISHTDLHLSFYLIFRKFQFWRLVTPFFFMGKLSIMMVSMCFMMTKYCGVLETQHFPGNVGRADMTFMFAFGALCFYVISYFYYMPFLSFPLMFMIIQVWARKDPFAPSTFWGFAFAAWQIPYVLLLFNVLLGGSWETGAIGILVGHLYIFLVDLVPANFGFVALKTPEFVYKLFEQTNITARHSGWQRSTGYRLQ